MKKLKFIAMILFIAGVAASCTKEEGPQGPAGPSGTNGTDGNANVIMYGFGSTSLNSGNDYWIDLYPPDLTTGMIDSSLIMCYYAPTPGNLWFVAGDIGPGSLYQTKFYIDRSLPSLSVRLYDVNGGAYTGSNVSWDSIRVFVIPANIFKKAEIDKVNFADYKEVKNYCLEK